MAKIYVRVKNKEQFEAVLADEKIGAVICGFGCISELSSKTFIKDIKKYNKKHDSKKEIFLSFPEIAREKKKEIIEKNLELLRMEQAYSDGVVVENLDVLGLLADKHYRGKVIGGSFLYAYNSEAVKFYRQYFNGIHFIAPDELTINEIMDIEDALKENYEASQNPRFNSEGEENGEPHFIFKVYGHQPVMITNQCMNRNYCGCMKPKLAFKDDKNNDFYITSECGLCHDIIYNGPVTYMLDRLDEVGARDILLDFTVETKDEVLMVLGILDRALAGEKMKPEKYTRGHYYKGID